MGQKDKIIEIIKSHVAYLEDADGLAGLFGVEDAAREIDSLYPTLNRDKVMEVLDENAFISTNDGIARVAETRFDNVADALCSLSLPTLSELEAALKELTKPKER
jgi:hypothetical protein